jgi:hypothetical protein
MVILVIVLISAVFLVPRFLTEITLTRSKELVVISIVAICFGIAYLNDEYTAPFCFGLRCPPRKERERAWPSRTALPCYPHS